MISCVFHSTDLFFISFSFVFFVCLFVVFCGVFPIKYSIDMTLK